jgi:hypothetical protein
MVLVNYLSGVFEGLGVVEACIRLVDKCKTVDRSASVTLI